VSLQAEADVTEAHGKGAASPQTMDQKWCDPALLDGILDSAFLLPIGLTLRDSCSPKELLTQKMSPLTTTTTTPFQSLGLFVPSHS
jgi:hypothetical protein